MTFLDEALKIKDETIAWRRDFHRHPELGLEERRTAAIVAENLEKFGLEVTTGIAQTGVVGMLRGRADGPLLLLRFDMDALPIQEETGVDYASEVPGKMHACGHDSHVAVGLSVAKLLSARKNEIPGTIKFVFQPGEEGAGGA
ncbi:MAG: amidohydrolase, partial [bacterium]